MLTVSFYVDAFAPKSGISDHVSTMTIVEGVKLDYNKHFKVIPGEYAQTFEGSDNTMKERTIGAIALGPAGNRQGGVRFSVSRPAGFSIGVVRIFDFCRFRQM